MHVLFFLLQAGDKGALSQESTKDADVASEKSKKDEKEDEFLLDY